MGLLLVFGNEVWDEGGRCSGGRCGGDGVWRVARGDELGYRLPFQVARRANLAGFPQNRLDDV